MLSGRAVTRFVHTFRIAIAVAAGATMVVGVAGTAAAEEATGSTHTEEWTALHDGPQQYPEIHIDWDVPIQMSDGAVLKANVYRPVDSSGSIVEQPLPTIVNLTPYSKLLTTLVDSALAIPGLQPLTMELARRINLSGTPISGFGDLLHALDGGTVRTVLGVDHHLIRSGYTLVVADVRGTGLSQGSWETLGEREQLDTREVIHWASTQPWSSGDIAMSGGSYAGINQLRAAENAPPELKAIFPVEPGSDLMRDVVAPGGGVGTTFLPLWLSNVNQMKLLPDIQSMFNGTFDWEWFHERMADPNTNVDLLLQALLTPSLDDVPPALGAALDADSPFRQGILGHPERITVPTFVYGGWHDIFANSATKLYNAIPLPAGKKQLVVGDTYHANPGAGTGYGVAPPRLDVMQRVWFDKWLKGIDHGINDFGPINIWQQGGGWITMAQFPQHDVNHRRIYLSAAASGSTDDSLHDGSLTSVKPKDQATLTVAPGLTTACSRDTAQGSAGMSAILDVCAKDSRIAETNGLTFTSAPVAEPTVISGPINVHLNTIHDATDGYWNVTINDVTPEGASIVLSTGQLTASMRTVDEAKSARSANGDYTAPYNLITLDSLHPVVAGKVTPLDIAVIPTQAVLQPGHRLRVDIFAGNSPKALAFRPLLNNTELKPQHLRLDPAAPSFVNLPSSRPVG
ncbi:CocE/NonD family hydrolase [Nocardia sp. NBC_01009]|uniref:CocE/NonD family hydrolase n=1 Tax=Nocardia sp. NBC_01009 TaxID=2975996 RepID=UPI003865D32F|nr:CocE/NonD family hydrolase [Nocardia sp. NBC_01009]